MQPVQNLAFVAIEGTRPQARVHYDGADVTLSGCILEGAWQVGDALLVASGDDIPDEDMLHFSLITGAEVDALTLGAAYSTGSFRELDRGATTLRFRFFGDADWQLEVLPQPALRLPWVGDPAGVSRAFGFRSRLRIEGAPNPGL